MAIFVLRSNRCFYSVAGSGKCRRPFFQTFLKLSNQIPLSFHLIGEDGDLKCQAFLVRFKPAQAIQRATTVDALLKKVKFYNSNEKTRKRGFGDKASWHADVPHLAKFGHTVLHYANFQAGPYEHLQS